MADRIEIGAVYLGGLAQGLALVAVPAAAAALTSAAGYGLSAAQYGMLFAPLAAAAVVASAAAGEVAGRAGMKPIFLLGLGLDLVAMALLAASRGFEHQPAAYPLLLAAMAALGGGFGAVLTAVNAYVPAFFPQRQEAALTALHTLLGAGTALAPVFVALLGPRRWTLLPLAVAVLLGALWTAAATRPLALA
ncbi:MAG: MFS transporter, partial [Terriglobales bacterium]